MNITELGAIGELVGGVAVLVTFVYLALQVKQGNEIARDSASQQWTAFNFTLAGDVVDDRALAEIWIRGGEDFDSLDSVDRQRMVLFEWRALELWHHTFHQHRRGVLPEDQWAKIEAIFKGPIGRRQSVKEAWRAFRPTYDADFQELVDPYLAAVGTPSRED
jgi:hypothetical protein